MPKEVESTSNNLHLNLHFVRHGEPVEYGETNSKLTALGREQMRNYAENFAKQIKGTESDVWVAFSSRARTFESAEVIAASLRPLLPNESLYHGLFSRTALEPTNTLDRLIELGIPKEKAFKKWRQADQAYSHLNISGIKEVRKDLMELMNNLYNIEAIKLLRKPNTHYILVTHETTLCTLAADMNQFNIKELDIGYGESLQVAFDESDVSYFFRGQKFSQNKENFLNS